MKFRGLKAEEIDVRVGSIMEDGATLLLYQDARCAMNILDETVGEENWQRAHKEIKGNLFCGIGIRSTAINREASHDEWIWKWDCGVESFTEKEKGESSDSMKRSAVNWGIGRELYTAPKIKIKCATKEKGDRRYELANKWEFWGCYVADIEYRETETAREIVKLVINDKDNKILYKYDNGKETKTAIKSEMKEYKDEKIGEKGAQYLMELITKTGTDLPMLLSYYEVDRLENMTMEQYNKARAILEKR